MISRDECIRTDNLTSSQYQTISMVMYYGIMTASKALGMDSSNTMYYLMFGAACIPLLYKYCVTRYTRREIALSALLGAAGAVCFVISHDMTVLLLAMTVIGLKGCDFREMLKAAFYIRLVITSIMIIASFLGIFDQGETAQTTTSFQDITVYNFGYSTANNAYINVFILMVLYLYINYDRLNWKHFAATAVISVLMYTFTNSRTGTLLYFVVWFFIFCEKFMLVRRARYAFFWLLSFLPLICAVFSFFASALFNPDGGKWSVYINRIFSGRLNITHMYHEALSVSLIPRSNDVMDAYRGFGFIDNAYMSVYFHDGLIVAVMLLVFICMANRRLFRAKHYRELVFIATFSVYAIMEEFPLNPVVNPFIMLIGIVVYAGLMPGKAAGEGERCVSGAAMLKPEEYSPAALYSEDVRQTVLIVHNYYRLAGGEDTVVANEKRMLEEHGHNVIMYERSNMELDSFSKLQKLCLPFTSIFSFKTYRDVRALIQENDVDIVHVHNTLSLVSPSVYYAAFSCGRPVIQTMHNFRLMCPQGSFFREPDRDGIGRICEDCAAKGLGCAVRHSCYRGSRLQTIVSAAIIKIHRLAGTYRRINYICLTRFNRYKLLQLNDKGKNIVNPGMVYIKPHFTYSLKDSLNEQPGTAGGQGVSIPAAGSYYVFSGRLEKLKGVDVLTDAFAAMPDKQLYILGDGPLRSSLEQKCSSRGVNNIHFAGRAKRDVYAAVLNNAKALVVTSQCYESFGMVIAEGYSLGLPVIAGDVGNVADMVVENKTGIHFKYNSADSLVEAVGRFESMDIDLMRTNSYQYYEENFTEEKNYQLLRQIYASVSQANCGAHPAEMR